MDGGVICSVAQLLAHYAILLPAHICMKFSVVIPAYNESRFIARSIYGLKQQNVNRDEFEIIVVDNNSTDDTAAIAKSAGADVVITEMIRGTNFARQRGFVESRGQIVAFLDADSEPPQDWLQRIEQDLLQPGVVAVSGPFDFGFGGRVKQRLDHLYCHKLLPHLSVILFFLFRRRAGVIIGGNFGVWRRSLEAIGGLPLLEFWGDDTAIAMLLSRRVGTVLFDPYLIVRSSARRFERHGFVRLALRYAWAYFRIYFSRQFS